MFKITYSNHDQGNHGGAMVRETKEIAERTAKLMAECERLAEEKETEREWLSDYANMVLEEAAKVCDTKAEFMAMMGGSCDPDVLAEQIRALKAPNPDDVFSGRKSNTK